MSLRFIDPTAGDGAMWDPREPPTWWILALVMVVLGAASYIAAGLPRWLPWIPLGLAFLFFLVGVRVRTRGRG